MIRYATALAIAAACTLPLRAAAQASSPADTSAAASAIPTVDEADLHEKPSLANRAQVMRLLTRAYPAALKERGIAGRAELMIIIDENGRPASVEVVNSSGNLELDQAALTVARGFRFTPPRRDGAPIRVRARIPVAFDVERPATDPDER